MKQEEKTDNTNDLKRANKLNKRNKHQTQALQKVGSGSEAEIELKPTFEIHESCEDPLDVTTEMKLEMDEIHTVSTCIYLKQRLSPIMQES